MTVTVPDVSVNTVLTLIAICGALCLVGAIALLISGLTIPGLVSLAGTVFLFFGWRTARRAIGANVRQPSE